MLILNKNIVQLVNENYIYARALNYLGIEFMDFTDKTLVEVCRDRNIPVNTVLKVMDSFIHEKEVSLEELKAYPTSLVIGYLKHSHQIFIKNRLPYINELIQRLGPGHSQDNAYLSNELRDLNLIFPVFLEDFIKHIYEEEDTLFGYILDLDNFDQKKPRSIANILFRKSKESLISIAEEHQDEDEMRGLREMIEAIQDRYMDDILVKTIVKELRAFDLELINHAAIENEILFPKAILLESEVLEALANLSLQN